MRDSCATRTGRPAKRCAEILVVLAREQSGRHDHRHLHAVQRGGEGGAQRHFRLAETDVAADRAGPSAGPRPGRRASPRWPTAGPRSRHRGSARRIRRKALRRRQKSRRLVQHARGGDLDQPLRHLADALLQPRLARLPADAAELVERDLGVFRAVARQKLDVLDGQEQLVAAGIMDFEAIVRRARRLDVSSGR